MNVEIQDFRGIWTDPLIELWNVALPEDPITARRFRDLLLLDPNFDPAGLKLAVVDDRLVGACHAVRRLVPLHGADLEPDQGWIGFFFVHPRERHKGVGNRLLEAALSWLDSHDRSTVSFSPTTPNYFLPGLDAWRYPEADRLLRKHDFRAQYDAVAMDLPLHGYAVPAEVRAHIGRLHEHGWRFGSPTAGDLVDLVPLARDSFSPDWGRAIREAVVAGLPLERIVQVRDPSGKLAGWAMHGTYENVVERFGPFGVLPEFRGAGVGAALLHLTLERMRAAGAHSAWFLWTSADSAAGRLYRRAGFETTRTFAIMRRG